MDEKAREGMTPQQFAKYGLLRLGTGQDLERIVKGGAPRRIAPTEEILALKPELRPRDSFFYLLLLIGCACQPRERAGVGDFNYPIKKSPSTCLEKWKGPLFFDL